MSHRRCVAIFGGGFNPPHLAHLFTVTYLLSRGDVDEVWLLPSAKHAFHKQMQPLSERVKLLEDAFTSDPRVRICLIEAEPEMSGLTYDTLDTLSDRYPQSEFKLVIGADNLTASHRWHRFDSLCARWSLIVLGRPGHEAALDVVKGEDWCHPGPTLMSVSSTQIREALRACDAPDWHSEPLMWVPEVSRDHVMRLYRDPHPAPVKVELPQEEMIFMWGSGRCGRALTQALSEVNRSVSLQSLRALESLDPTHSPSDIDVFLDKPIWSSVMHRARQAPIWIIACRDDEISLWAQRLYLALSQLGLDSSESPTQHIPNLEPTSTTEPHSSLALNPRVVIHCSGARDHEDLAHLRKWGCAVGRMHPLMSLRGVRDLESLREASYLVTGDPQACQEAQTLVKDLGGSSLSSPSAPSALSEQERMVIYHCAAALGANLATVPLVLGEILFAQLGYSRRETISALRTLYRVALSPQLSDQIATDQHAQAQWTDHLTGPVSRGDRVTIKKHIDALLSLSSHFKDRDQDLSNDREVSLKGYELSALRALPELYRSLCQVAAKLSDQEDLAEHIDC